MHVDVSDDSSHELMMPVNTIIMDLLLLSSTSTFTIVSTSCFKLVSASSCSTVGRSLEMEMVDFWRLLRSDSDHDICTIEDRAGRAPQTTLG